MLRCQNIKGANGKAPCYTGGHPPRLQQGCAEARRRWLATKLMGQQPRRAEAREGRASREQLGTCFPAHGNYGSPGEGKCACLPGTAPGWRSLVDRHLSPQLHLPWIGPRLLSHPSICPSLCQEPIRWALMAGRSTAGKVAPREFRTSMGKGLRHRLLVRALLTDSCPTLIKVRKLLGPLPPRPTGWQERERG